MIDKIFWINVNDIKQHLYCKRISFYGGLLPIEKRATYGMEAGKFLENSITERQIKKLASNEIKERFDILKNLKLSSGRLMLKGKLDYVLRTKNLAIPIEIKFSRKPTTYTVQLAAYSVLLEDTFNVISDYGYFLYKHTDTKLKSKKVQITYKDKIYVKEVMTEIRENIRNGVRPEPTTEIAKCTFCEFRNFCDDIF